MILNDYLICIKYFELAAAIVGFFYINKLKGTKWVALPFFLLLLFLLECYGQFLGTEKKIAENLKLYKYVIMPIIFIFYSYLFKHILSKKRVYLFYVGLFLFGVSLTLDATILRENNPFYSSLSISVTNIFFLVYVLTYFFEIIKLNKLIDFHKNIAFWFSAGILIFYLGCLPYFNLYNLLAKKFFNTIFIPYTWGFIFLNYTMYLFFIIGFIWNKKKS